MKKKKKKILSYEELMQEFVEFEATTKDESRQHVLNIMLAGALFICFMIMVLEKFQGKAFVMCLIGVVSAMYLLKWNNTEGGDQK